MWPFVQVSKHAYDECDVSSKPLKEWSQASIPGTVTVSGLAPGTYYFTSTVSGECTAGMKVAIVVNPRPNVHIFGRLKQAKCLSQYCSYSAKEDQTPVLLSIEVRSVASFSWLIFGRNFILCLSVCLSV